MSGFSLLPKLTGKARKSKIWLWVLNLLLARTIPFNGPHRFRILELGDERVRTTAPYRRNNHNHLRGIHACAIATVAEFSAGLLLLTRLGPARYRLIMSNLDIEYLFQAKQCIVAESSLDNDRLQREILQPLKTQDAQVITLETLVSDSSDNLIAKARTTWQIKRWDKVRTKV